MDRRWMRIKLLMGTEWEDCGNYFTDDIEKAKRHCQRAYLNRGISDAYRVIDDAEGIIVEKYA